MGSKVEGVSSLGVGKKILVRIICQAVRFGRVSIYYCYIPDALGALSFGIQDLLFMFFFLDFRENLL